MGIEWYRDLSITILGFVTTIALIFVAIIIYRLYSKTMATLCLIQTLTKSLNDTINTLQANIETISQNINETVSEVKDGIKQVSKGIGDTVTRVQEGIKPVLPVLSVIQEICGAFSGIRQLFKKQNNEGGNCNE